MMESEIIIKIRKKKKKKKKKRPLFSHLSPTKENIREETPEHCGSLY
jgi:hypothetical protein